MASNEKRNISNVPTDDDDDDSESTDLNIKRRKISTNEEQSHNFEVYKSSWQNKKVCAMLWKDSARPTAQLQAQPSDVVEATADDNTTRRPIGVQLLTSDSNGSCSLFVDHAFRSSQVKWELNELESQKAQLNCKVFKKAFKYNCTKDKTYDELFSKESPDTDYETIYDRRECEREDDTENSSDELKVEIKRSTYREATIEWSFQNAQSALEKWLVVIRNEGRTPRNNSDKKQKPEWLIILESDSSKTHYKVDNDLVHLEYQAGHIYSVQVIGLKAKQEFGNTACYTVMAFAEKSFRAEYTEEDLKLLLDKAKLVKEHIVDTYTISMKCKWLYRDKSTKYFNDLKTNDSNVMKVYDKDANGDPAAAIHGQLKGLFFSANVNFETGQPQTLARFGNVRVKIPLKEILTENTNMYFGDFYCLNITHLVTIVVTRSGSEADEFCKQKNLPLLSRTAGENNPFLYFSNDGHAYVSSRITVEVFYTEDIDLNELSSRYSGLFEQLQPYGWRDKRHGEKWKQPDCSECNLYTESVAGALLV